MHNIGVSLVDKKTGAELQSWPNVPREIVHEGETRTGAIVGAEIGKGALLVNRITESETPFGKPEVAQETATFDGEKVIITRTYAAPNLDVIKARIIADVKARAGQIILAYCPQYKQANLTARAVEIALTLPGVSGDELPEPQRSEWVAGLKIWETIKSIRAHSDVLEAEVSALKTADDLQQWKQHDWPVP